MDRGATAVSTDQSGHYVIENAYPLTEWFVLEAYDDRYYTTGVTYQADNQAEPDDRPRRGRRRQRPADHRPLGQASTGASTPTTPDGANGVDPQNGGIVGSVSYDTTRNELDPQYAAAEDWQPGVQGVTVELHAPVLCGTNARARRATRVATTSSTPTGRTPRASCSTPTCPSRGRSPPAASPATWTATRSPTRPTSRSCRWGPARTASRAR